MFKLVLHERYRKSHIKFYKKEKNKNHIFKFSNFFSASTDDDEKVDTSDDKNVEEAAVDHESDVSAKRKGCSSWCCMKGIKCCEQKVL